MNSKPVSKKKVQAKNKGKDQSNTLIFIGVIVGIVIIAAIALYYASTHPGSTPQQSWSLDSSGRLQFPDRSNVQATSTLVEDGANYTLEKIVYKSFGDDVYAYLRIPKNVTRPPVVIVLPAATINKELDRPMAEGLSSMGYASLTLDERGNNGETTGPFMGNWTDGYFSYVNGSVPVQYKQIYDVLKGLDYVKSRSDLDGNDTAIVGESIGGMWSIIAAAEDSRFKGVICVSSSGFNFTKYNDAKIDSYFSSISPENYLSKLPPRKLVMIHFMDDQIIPVQYGRELYDRASQPKALYQYNGSTHGLFNMTYVPDMQKELKGMLGR